MMAYIRLLLRIFFTALRLHGCTGFSLVVVSGATLWLQSVVASLVAGDGL